MARELADVLHHFLGPDPGAAPALVAPCLAVLAEPDDALAVGVTWNLAHELVRLGCQVVWVTAPADEELLPAEATPGLFRLLAPALGLRDLGLAAREACAKLAAAKGPSLVLLRVPPRWITPGAAGEQLLGNTLQLVGPDAAAHERALRLASRVRQCRPGARMGVTLHDVRSVEEAAHAFAALTREQIERGEAPLTSYGLLLEEAEIYRSLLARQPLLCSRADTRAASALADLARLVRSDLGGDAA